MSGFCGFYTESIRNGLVNQIMRNVLKRPKFMHYLIRGVHAFMCDLGASDWVGREMDVLLGLMQMVCGVAHHDNLPAIRHDWELVVDMCRMVMECGIRDRKYVPTHFLLDVIQRIINVESDAFDGAMVGRELRDFLRNGMSLYRSVDERH